MKKIQEATDMLEGIKEEKTVPENIRSACDKAICSLKNDKKELEIKLNEVLSILDAIAEDPNIPVYARTKIWTTVSKLEEI